MSAEFAGYLSGRISDVLQNPWLSYMNFDYRIIGTENIPPHRPCILAATHYSTDPNNRPPYDALSIMRHVSRATKKPILTVARIDPPDNSSYTGPASQAFRKGLMTAPKWVLPIYTDSFDGGMRETAETARPLVKKGASILIFPWGRTYPDFSSEYEIKGGFAFLADQLGLPVVPVYFHGPKNGMRGDFIHIEFGKSFEVVGSGRRKRESAIDQVRSAWVKMHEEFESSINPEI